MQIPAVQANNAIDGPTRSQSIWLRTRTGKPIAAITAGRVNRKARTVVSHRDRKPRSQRRHQGESGRQSRHRREAEASAAIRAEATSNSGNGSHRERETAFGMRPHLRAEHSPAIQERHQKRIECRAMAFAGHATGDADREWDQVESRGEDTGSDHETSAGIGRFASLSQPGARLPRD